VEKLCSPQFCASTIQKEGKVIEFIRQFGVSLGLETTVDETGNVLIRKPATQGMEDHKTVVLQSHLDMVCQKIMRPILILTPKGIKMLVWRLGKGRWYDFRRR
jgi:dipeptidase D